MTNVMTLPQVGPYVGVSRDEIVQDGKYRVLLYGAYNAMGLIGPECNGIAVLDQGKMSVLLDEEAKEPSGYFGPSRAQERRYKEIMAMSLVKFRQWVNRHPRSRYPI